MQNFFSSLPEGQKGQHYKTYVKRMWYLAFAGLFSVILLFILISFSDLPSVEQLENPKSELASQVFANNGEVIGRYYTENRVPVSFDSLSDHLVNALIATEDERYYEHTGIDFEALGRAVIKTGLLGQTSAGGASTITQQLAKQLFTKQRANGFERVLQKFKEWIIAVRLERRYTKQEIIAMYLNIFDFIHNAHGVAAASEIYFNKPQQELEVQEAANLIGMLKNPYLFNPLKFPDNAKKRREVVLKQMQKNNLLTQVGYDSLRQLPLGVRYTKQTHVDGIAPYFRMEVAKDVKKILATDAQKKSDGKPYDIYRDGLKVYTTLDPKMQRIAEQEMKKHMAKVQKTFWRRWKNMDPWTYKGNSDLEISLGARKQSLTKLVRSSDRYQGLRQKYLGDIIGVLEREIEGMQFSEDDREIERIVAEAEKKGRITKLVSRKIISASRAEKYRRVLDSDNFPTLLTQWNQLQDVAKEIFDTPVEMKVFAYTEDDKMETDTLMSPLDSVKYHRMFLQTGIMAVDPVTGYVKVWVGGINYKYFQYDHVRINRQVGSTFKPFIYATAIAQQGISPCFQVYDLPQTIQPGDGNFWLKDEWTPQNSDGRYTGDLLTLKDGLRKSKNTVSVYLMKLLGDTEPVRGLVHQMGLDSSARYPNGRFRVPKSPSICLGSTDLSVMEMTGAYTTFANNGLYNKPTFIMRIEDKNGRVIYEELPTDRLALPPNANYVMLEMLKYSGTGLGMLKSEAGGKTGTTNDFVDGWFMGITPNLVVGTWTGGEDRWIRFRNLTWGQGGYMAKPFFRQFIKALEEDESVDYDISARFYRPKGDIGIELDCSKYEEIQLEEDPLNDGDSFGEDLFGDEEEAPKKPIAEDQNNE